MAAEKELVDSVYVPLTPHPTVRPMRAATGQTSIDCEEKRDPRNDATL